MHSWIHARRGIRWFSSLFTFAIFIAESAGADEKITFDDHAKPIFQQRCASCHNGDKKSGGLDLTNYTNMMQGGSSGTSIEAGDADNSYLYLLVTHDESPEMPPGGNKIPDEEISLLASWINGGALENKGSVATKKKQRIVVSGDSVGVRPESVAFPLRMSLEPSHVTTKTDLVKAMATSPWTSLIALAGAKQIVLYDTSTTELLGTLPFNEGRANSLKFSRNGSLLVAGGGKHGLVGKVFGWDVETGERVFEIGEEIDNVLAADISTDHSLVALGGPQKMLRVYSTQSENAIYEVKKHTDWVTAIEFSPDGVLLASADRAGGLQLWEAESGNEYLSLPGHGKPITSLSWRSDGNVLASVGDDGAVRLWEVENGRQIKAWNAHAQGVAGVQFTRDGNLVTTGRDKLVKRWQQDGKLVRQFKGLGEIGTSVTFCNETKKVIASDLNGRVEMWNADDGAKVAQLEANPIRLGDRLRNAEQQVVETDVKIQPLKSSVAKLNERLNKLATEIKAQQDMRNRFAAELDQIRNSLANSKSAIDSNATNIQHLQTKLTESETALPVLKASLDKSVEASKLLPTDTKLKEISQALAIRHQTLSESIAKFREELEVFKNNEKMAAAKITTFETELKDKESNFAKADKRVQEISSQQKPVLQQRETLQSQLKELEAKLALYREHVAKWSSEIEFSSKLAAKHAELAAATKRVDQTSGPLNTAQQKLDEARIEFEKIKAAKKELLENESRIESELREMRKRN